VDDPVLLFTAVNINQNTTEDKLLIKRFALYAAQLHKMLLLLHN